ncbi:MAG TPA: TIGR03668 family PPOX class F420-dependent oxidoreductase [Candidatus Limnocylindria bacterium]
MPSLSEEEARSRLAAARVAHLATTRRDGRPHVVPIVFAADGDLIYSIADPKPKSGLDLLRHRNIAANPAVSLLVDAYHEPWGGIWWVRVDGSASVVENGPRRETAIRLLRAKYADYQDWTEPFGAATVIRIERVTSWSMEGP